MGKEKAKENFESSGKRKSLKEILDEISLFIRPKSKEYSTAGRWYNPEETPMLLYSLSRSFRSF